MGEVIPPCDLSRDLRDQGVEEGLILQEEESPEILLLHQASSSVQTPGYSRKEQVYPDAGVMGELGAMV